jgi:hypothetical protein
LQKLPDKPGVLSNCGAAFMAAPSFMQGVSYLPSKTAEQRERAEAKFERLQKVAEEGRVAMAEYKAAAAAMRRKTERLRALRLAHEAGLISVPPPSVVKGAGKIATKRASKRAKQDQKTH